MYRSADLFSSVSDFRVKKGTELSTGAVILSEAWRSGSERRFYDDHDRKVNGSTPNLVALLRPWIRCFTMIISAWWYLASSKLKEVKRKFNRKTQKQRQLLSESGLVLRIAPQPLSRNRRIKMKKSINQLITMYIVVVHFKTLQKTKDFLTTKNY